MGRQKLRNTAALMSLESPFWREFLLDHWRPKLEHEVRSSVANPGLPDFEIGPSLFDFRFDLGVGQTHVHQRQGFDIARNFGRDHWPSVSLGGRISEWMAWVIVVWLHWRVRAMSL
jgi:hypothetical protein